SALSDLAALGHLSHRERQGAVFGTARAQRKTPQSVSGSIRASCAAWRAFMARLAVGIRY
ncbi:MAG: hypothetical protein IIX99_04205, partial [Oscillospiraceae bacterium]|nr:hypothetical protein [Oscillospiraceae bacterium]